MKSRRAKFSFGVVGVMLGLLVCGAYADRSALNLGPKEFVQANGVDIVVFGYSIPSYVDWNNDGMKDLIVGEGGNWWFPRIRVWLNQGTTSEPDFSDYFYAEKSFGGQIVYVGEECHCYEQGLFPRVVYWDGDARQDLLVGQLDGTIMIYINVGTDDNPVFDGGTFIKVGQPGHKVNIDVESLAAVCVADWNNDGRKDLIAGANEPGMIHLFINEGTDTAPDFLTETFARRQDGPPLIVPSGGSSPVIVDLDRDARKDLLTGTRDGQLLLYRNVNTDAVPVFSDYSVVEANGVPIEVEAVPGISPLARPFVCDWTDDGYLDVLVGAGDGKVYLYQSIPQPGDIDKDYDVDFRDFAILALAWGSSPGDDNWNQFCDISEPNDNVIDPLDIAVLAENWLSGIE